MSRTSGKKRQWPGLALTVLVAVGVGLLLREHVVMFGLARGGSMSPAVPDGSFLVIDKTRNSVSDVDRGDLVAVRPPDDLDVPDVPVLEGNLLVKRVIGLPGETVAIRDSTVIIDEVALEEPYLAAGLSYADADAVTVPDDAIYVLGDDRPASTDSRQFGPVVQQDLVGIVVINVAPRG